MNKPITLATLNSFKKSLSITYKYAYQDLPMIYRRLLEKGHYVNIYKAELTEEELSVILYAADNLMALYGNIAHQLLYHSLMKYLDFLIDKYSGSNLDIKDNKDEILKEWKRIGETNARNF